MESIERIAEYEASVGVTAIAPATMTLPVEELVDVLKTAAQYKHEKHDYKKADLVGINMEGPFISPVKKALRMTGISFHVILPFVNASWKPQKAWSNL